MKKFIQYFALFFLCLGYVAKAQVVVTPASLNNLCVGGGYATLGTITIQEGNPTNISAGLGQTMLFAMPTGFELDATATPTVTILSAGVINSTVVTSNNVTINYDATNSTDGFTIAGLKVRATSAGSGNMTYDGSSTGSIVGLSGGTVVASFVGYSAPVVNVFNSGITACAGKQILFAATGASEYFFQVKQGATIIATQIFSASSAYITSTSLPAGSYTIDVKGRNGGACEGAINTTAFTINPLPATIGVVAPYYFCLNTLGTTTVSVSSLGTVRWYTDAGLLALAKTGTSATLTELGINTTSAGTHTIYVTTDNGTCESAARAITININPLPSLSMFATASQVCVGSTITFIAGGSGIQYEFVLKKGASTLNTQAYSVTPFYTTSTTLVAGSDYAIEVTAKDANNCASTVSTTPFTILSLPPTPIVSGQPITYCLGADISLTTVTATGIVGGNTVKWYSDPLLTNLLSTGATVNATSLGISTATLGNYTRYVTQEDATCRSAVASVNFKIEEVPFVGIWNDSYAYATYPNVCQGTVFKHYAYSNLATNYTFELYEVGMPNVLKQTVSNTTGEYSIPSTLAVGTYFVRVIGTAPSSCSGSSDHPSFGILPKPTVVFNALATTTFADSDSNPVILTGTPPSTGEFAYFSGSGVVGNQFYPNAAGGVGIKTLKYTLIGVNGCSATDSVKVTISTGGFFVNQGYCHDAPPTPLVPPACASGVIDDAVAYTDASIPANSIQNIAGVFNFVPSVVTITASSDYQYWDGAALSTSCASYYYYIGTNVYKSPVPVITTLNSGVCVGSTGNYVVDVPTFNNTTANVTYFWDFDTSGGAVAGTIVGANNTNTVSVQWGSAGTGKLRVTRTIDYILPTATSCAKTTTFNVTVNPLPTSAIKENSVLGVIPDACQGSTKQYTVASSFTNYVWSVTNGAITAGQNTSLVTVQWNTGVTSGNLDVQLTAPTTCVNNISGIVNLLALPTNTVTGLSQVCQSVVSAYQVTSIVPNHTYVWTITGVTNSFTPTAADDSKIDVTWGGAGTAIVTLQITNTITGCSNTIPLSVIVSPAVVNDLPSSTNISVCKGTTKKYTTTYNNSYYYTWTVTDGTIVNGANSNEIEVLWTSNLATTTGTVKLKVNSSTTPCEKEEQISVNLHNNPTPAIPNTNAVVCALSQDVLYETISNAGSNYVWTVTDTNNGVVPFTTVSGNPHQILVDWGSTITGKVKVVETNSNTCARADSLSIAINPLPIPAIIGETVTCATNTRTYATPATGNQFSWSVVGGAFASATDTDQVSIIWGDGASGTITLVETNPITLCTKTVTKDVTINPLPAPVIGSNLPISYYYFYDDITGELYTFPYSDVCQGQAGVVYSVPEVFGHKYEWEIFGGTITAGKNSNSIVVTWGNSGWGYIELKQTNLFTTCFAYTYIDSNINPLPEPSISGLTTVCANSTGHSYSTNQVTGNTYAWTVIGGTITSGQGTGTITVNWGQPMPPGSARIELLETTTTTGCSRQVKHHIQIQPLPHPVISPTTSTCAGSTVTYQIPDIPGSTYTWSVTDGIINSGQGTSSISVTWSSTVASGTIQVTQVLQTSLCANLDIKTITLTPLPAPIITGDNIVCATSVGKVYSVPAVSGHTYSWIVTGGDIVDSNTGNSITVNWDSNPAGAKVQVEQTSNTNCKTIMQRAILINPLPNPNITPKDGTCENSTITYSTPPPLIAGSTYIWTVTGGSFVTTPTPTNNTVQVKWGVSGLGQITVQETNSFSCKKTVSQSIPLRTIPNPSINGTFEVCANTPNISYTISAQAGHEYSWTVTGGAIIGSNISNSIVVNWGGAGTGLVQVTQTDKNFPTNCSKTDSKIVNIRALPAPVIARVAPSSTPFQICANTMDVQYSVPSVANHSYKWEVIGGTIVAGATQATVTINWNSDPNNARLELEQTDENFGTNCKTKVVQNIIINPLPTPNISGLALVCASQGGEIYKVVAVAGHTYLWEVTGGAIIGSNTNNSIAVNWANMASTSAQVKITQTNATTNCQKEYILPVTVQALPAPRITGSVMACASVLDPNVGTNNQYLKEYATDQTSDEYEWQVTGGTIISGHSSNKITVLWNNDVTVSSLTGKVKVTQKLKNSPFCSSSDSLAVTINTLPEVDFRIDDICFDSNTLFTPINVPANVGNTSWTWKFSEGKDSTQKSSALIGRKFGSAGLKNVDLVVKDTLTGCEFKIGKSFYIRPVPEAKFIYENTCEGDETIFTSVSRVDGTYGDAIRTYHWAFSPTDVTVTTVPILRRFLSAGKHTLTLTVATNSCSDTLTKEVRIYPSITVTDTAPYNQNFETGAGGWLDYGFKAGNPVSSWKLGKPADTRNIKLNSVINGLNVWTTGRIKNYANNENSAVASPCFDIRSLESPMLSFDYWVDADNKSDGAFFEYTIDDGKTWHVLGEIGRGVEWYNADNILGLPNDYNLNETRKGWTGKGAGWKTAKYSLDAVRALTERTGAKGSVRFAIAFGSSAENPQAVDFDGFAFDNFYIGNRQQRALIEHFTTPESAAENDAVDKFSTEATKLQYHMKGQLYTDNPADVTARALLYGVTVPDKDNTRAALNGMSNTSKKFSEWVPIEAERQLLGVPVFDLKINFLPTTTTLNFEVVVKALQEHDKDVVLHIAMVEDSIHNSQVGAITYKNVLKKMLPSAAGTTYRYDWKLNDKISVKQEIALYDLSASTPSAPKFYDWNNLKIVAFLQNFDDNVVLQVVELKPTVALPARITALADDGQGDCLIYPNPAQNNVFIGFEEGAFRQYNWEIQTVQGQTIGRGTIGKGERGANIDTKDYPSGLYVVKITNPQNKTSWVSKLVIRK